MVSQILAKKSKCFIYLYIDAKHMHECIVIVSELMVTEIGRQIDDIEYWILT
jgi:hypothetical protein